jgi:ATP-dependent Lhr-like helicase
VLKLLETRGELVHGEMRPLAAGGGQEPEWCDAEVMRRLRRRTLARARNEVAPVDGATLGRFLPDWQGVGGESRHARDVRERLLEALLQLEGLTVSWTQLDRVLLPARVPGYRSEDLDMLAATGQVVWVGRGAAGPKDGKVAIYRRDNLALAQAAAAASSEAEAASGYAAAGSEEAPEDSLAPRLRAALLEQLQRRGACFLMDLQRAAEPVLAGVGASAGSEAFDAALWDLVWGGVITNDTFAPLRALAGGKGRSSGASNARRGGRRAGRRGPGAGLGGSLRTGLGRGAAAGMTGGLAGGRWSLVADLAADEAISDTERVLLTARMLLERYGILSREAVAAEALPGGFGPVYRVLKELEEGGQVRRGHFVEGLSGAQFALPGAVERLRAAREDEVPMDGYTDEDVRILAAADPANPYGALLSWPETAAALVGSVARAGAGDGELARGDRSAAVRGKNAAPTEGTQHATAAKQAPKRRSAAGAWVVLVAGKPVLYLGANARQLMSFPGGSTDTGRELELAAAALHRIPSGRKRLLIQHVDGLPALESPLRETLIAAGFELDYDALAPARFRPGGTGRDPNAVACAGPRG